MKKLIPLALVLLMCLSLAACGDKPTQNNNKPGNIETQTAAIQQDPLPDNTEPQGETEQLGSNASVDPNADGVLVSWGGVLKYDPDKWEKTTMGLAAKDSDAEIVFMSYGYTVDEMVQNIENNAEEITVEDITVNGNSAKKVIYTSGWTPNKTSMSVIIDTSFIGSSFSTVFEIELSVEKGSADEALLDDAAVWEMINSFYYDEALG